MHQTIPVVDRQIPRKIKKLSKKIIEFYGDRFHGNPELFADEDCCHPFNSSLTSMDMKNRDEKRNNILTERGYSVKIVWENDFRKNADRIIDECKDFLTS